MNYAKIEDEDVVNGQGIGVSLFVQGCHFSCPGCFNPETHDFNGGKEWTDSTLKRFIQLIDRPYIKRVTILGGEALAAENVSDVLNLVKQIRLLFGHTKTIWIYTGYVWESIMNRVYFDDDFDYISESYEECLNEKREQIIRNCDVLVDGRFEKDKADLSYPFAGSTNQRVIDVQKSIEKGEVILWL